MQSRLSCEEMRIMLNDLSGEICISMEVITTTKKEIRKARESRRKATDKQIIGIK